MSRNIVPVEAKRISQTLEQANRWINIAAADRAKIAEKLTTDLRIDSFMIDRLAEIAAHQYVGHQVKQFIDHFPEDMVRDELYSFIQDSLVNSIGSSHSTSGGHNLEAVFTMEAWKELAQIVNRGF